MTPSARKTHIRPLALLLALAATPACAMHVTFTGTEWNDTPTPMPGAPCSPGQVRVAFNPSNASVSGTSNLGAFAPSMAHCLVPPPPPTPYSGGVFDFAFAAGDDLTGSYSGYFTPTATPGLLNTFINFVVSGGTGRFLGASGTFTGVGLLDRRPARPINSVNLSGELNLPAVPEPSTWLLMIAGFGLVGVQARRRSALSAA